LGTSIGPSIGASDDASGIVPGSIGGSCITEPPQAAIVQNINT
jgi:hypothetical protein